MASESISLHLEYFAFARLDASIEKLHNNLISLLIISKWKRTSGIIPPKKKSMNIINLLRMMLINYL